MARAQTQEVRLESPASRIAMCALARSMRLFATGGVVTARHRARGGTIASRRATARVREAFDDPGYRRITCRTRSLSAPTSRRQDISAIPTAAAMADATGMSASGATYMRFLLVEDSERAGGEAAARARRVPSGTTATIEYSRTGESILTPRARQYFT
jgi:hypothetical protein